MEPIILIIFFLPDTEENALRDHFDECGEITNVRIIRDKKTGLGKGIAYVQFEASCPTMTCMLPSYIN